MYPLKPYYEGPILDFIDRLRAEKGLRVEVNDMSTQLFGEYDLIMDTLKREVKESFQQGNKVSMVLKILNTDFT